MANTWIAGTASLAALALPLVFYSPDKSRAQLEAAYSGDYRLVDGVRIRLRDTGPRNAETVIFLHGFCSSLETWEPWAKALSTNYRVVRFDLPGFGLTGIDPTGDYSDQREIKILTDLMDQLEIAKATLVGNSMGGRIAWRFAASNAERVHRLVLVSPSGAKGANARRETAPGASSLLQILAYFSPPRLFMMAALSAAYGSADALNEATIQRYRDLLLAPGVRQALVVRIGQLISTMPEPTLSRVSAPTLLIWGEKDEVIPISNAQAYLQQLPKAKLVKLANLGHVPFEEEPTASLIPVAAFLSGETP